LTCLSKIWTKYHLLT